MIQNKTEEEVDRKTTQKLERYSREAENQRRENYTERERGEHG